MSTRTLIILEPLITIRFWYAQRNFFNTFLEITLGMLTQMGVKTKSKVLMFYSCKLFSLALDFVLFFDVRINRKTLLAEAMILKF